MAKFPNPPPPAELRHISPVVTTVARGMLWWRIYFQGGPHPTAWDAFRHYGPVNARFDHHPSPTGRYRSHGVYYCAEHGVTCLAEVFQDTRVIDRTARDPWLVGFELQRNVLLLDMTGAWPTRAGASMKIHSGPRPRAWHWARHIYAAYPHIEGLLYCSSMHANQPSVVLWERASSAVSRASLRFHRPLADPHMHTVLQNAARKVGYGII